MSLEIRGESAIGLSDALSSGIICSGAILNLAGTALLSLPSVAVPGIGADSGRFKNLVMVVGETFASFAH